MRPRDSLQSEEMLHRCEQFPGRLGVRPEMVVIERLHALRKTDLILLEQGAQHVARVMLVQLSRRQQRDVAGCAHRRGDAQVPDLYDVLGSRLAVEDANLPPVRIRPVMGAGYDIDRARERAAEPYPRGGERACDRPERDEFQRDHRAAVQGVGVLGAVCVGLVERVQGAEMRSHAERTGKVLVGEQWRGVDTRHGAARDEVGNDCDGVVAVADCAG